MLQKYVSDGAVDYDSIYDAEFSDSLAQIRSRSLPTDRDSQYAFLLNAYNICVIDCVRRRLLKHGKQVRNLNNLWTRFQFFFLTPVSVGNRRMSLYRLEFSLIKPHLRRDPRGHFALVCASKGCPPLREGRYHGPTLSQELEQATRAFVRSSDYDADKNILSVSRIFKWYAKDFEAVGGVPSLLALHHSAMQHNPKIRFQRYDWNLNTIK